MNPSRINYVIPHPIQDLGKASLFQGFTPGILAASKFVQVILTLPQDVLQLYFTRDQVIGTRLNGDIGYNIIPVQYDVLDVLPIIPELPFFVFFSDEQTFDTVSKFIDQTPQPVLHVSTIDTKSTIRLDRFSSSHLRRYVKTLIKYFREQGQKKHAESLEEISATTPRRRKRKLNLKPMHHTCTAPNYFVLSSMDFSLSEGGPLLSEHDETYFEAVATAARLIVKDRNRYYSSGLPFYAPPKCDVILTAPSMYRHWHRKSPTSKELGDFPNPYLASKILNHFTKQKKFSLSVEVENAGDLFNDQGAMTLIQMRRSEIDAYVAGISVLACDSLAPVLRLPPAINNLHGEFKKLGDCARGNAPRRQSKMNRLAGQICGRLEALMPDQYLSMALSE